MKSLRRVASTLVATSLAIAGLAGSSSAASTASVVVPPGQAGHTCSGYHHVTPQHYWQTCTWADHQYVWFTVNFGNTDTLWWRPSWTQVDYIKSGVKKDCGAARWEGEIEIQPNSVMSTPRLACVITRVPGAYASRSEVHQDTFDYTAMNSPTLQVQ
ncbi:hypothetical protein OG394_19985 [Kribbella sp. NBC_01245]|uniref:hypothetical protein n=1 Tax=Kribbella sp. NBC_01245 TaxID=2903578 RepID=UPI002E2D1BF2|nr:hypothetical protein [Kribbella sp. NBC_01245]